MRSSRRYRFRFDLRSRLVARVAAWARRRQGEDPLPLTLLPRRLYILPTRVGLVAATVLFLMLLGGLNYDNSLGLLLCFMLGGMALVSMYECHRTLHDLRVRAGYAEESFAGQGACLHLQFENAHRRMRRLLQIRCGACAPTRFQLSAGALADIRLAYPADRRGRYRLPVLELSSTAPIGLFRAWTWIHLPLEVLVYPHPKRWGPLPPPAGSAFSGQRRHEPGDEEWALLREYRSGDSPRSVAWKAYAHGGPMLVAQYEAPAAHERVLDFARLSGLTTEQRLAQLTDWVLESERRNEAYGLRLPGHSVPPGCGRAHRRACLEALALYPG